MPKVSVILPMHNAERFLKKSIRSILAQSFSDFEVIIINDGSTDNSLRIVESFRDKRIKILNNSKKIGISNSLNLGIQNSSGEYIARMDADDICLYDRLKVQNSFLDRHLNVDVVGSYFKTFWYTIPRKICPPIEDNHIKAGLLFNPVLGHPVVMMRKSSLLSNELSYNSHYDGAEDYELWVRSSSKLCFANIPEILLLYRIHPKQISSKNRQKQMKIADSIRLEYISKLNITLTEKEKEIHLGVCRNDINFLNEIGNDEVLKWKNALINQVSSKELSDAFFDEIHKRLKVIYEKNIFKLSLRKRVKEIILKMNQDRDRGLPPLPHHRACGSAPGGSKS